MTLKEAIGHAKKELSARVYQAKISPYPGIAAFHNDHAEWLSQLIQAAERAVPEKMRTTETGATVCPCCNRFIERHEQSHGNLDIPHCKWCGQTIDWMQGDE